MTVEVVPPVVEEKIEIIPAPTPEKIYSFGFTEKEEIQSLNNESEYREARKKLNWNGTLWPDWPKDDQLNPKV